MDTGSFLSALLAIIVIDLVLAGDNAIVIALAARNLPEHLQKRAILWGALGAICVRSLMTIIVVWLLKIPGLLLAGGAALVWIAYKLLLPEDNEGGEDAHGPAATSFWAAMRTIVVADAIMGLDNVLAVAGAAHGSYLLVVLGLLISVPIVMWGSGLVLRLVERFPGVVYIGSGVLAWTAAKMIGNEPILKPWLGEVPALSWLLYLIVPAVLWVGLVQNHRRLASRIHARLAAFAEQLPRSSTRDQPVDGASGKAMLKVLVPVDGSPNSLHAVRHAISEYQRQHDLELHLVNVQARLSRHVARFVNRGNREDFYREQADRAMQAARDTLDAAQVPYQLHRVLGDRARAIVDTAQRLGCHHLVMGTARKNSLTRMVEDSVTNRVLELTTIPVEVIAGEAVSKLERYGILAGIGAGLGLLALGLALALK
jgi:YjbE family integral membrane protein